MYFFSALILTLSLALTGSVANPGAVNHKEFGKPKTSKPARCGAGIVALDQGDLYNTKPRSMDYIIVEPWEHGRIKALRKANPRAKILMYKNLSSVRSDRSYDGTSSTGLTTDQMQENWFLHDRQGNRAQWADYTDLYAANISLRAYQKKWISEVRKDLRAHDWDGVMVDDTLTTLSHPLVGGGTPREIPTDSHMYKATENALKHIGPALKSQGYLVMPNITVFWDNWEKPIKTWSKYVSGWENEYLVKWGLTKMERFQESNDWKWKYTMARWLAKNNVPLVGITYSNRNDRAAQLYHRATWLLSWNGRQGASVFVPYENEVNHVVRLANLKMGRPQAQPKHLANGLYSRVYNRGLVVVNPTDHAINIRFNKTYHKSNGKVARSITLAPSSGELLFKHRVVASACKTRARR